MKTRGSRWLAKTTGSAGLLDDPADPPGCATGPIPMATIVGWPLKRGPRPRACPKPAWERVRPARSRPPPVPGVRAGETPVLPARRRTKPGARGLAGAA